MGGLAQRRAAPRGLNGDARQAAPAAPQRADGADVVGWNRVKVREWTLATTGLGLVALVLGGVNFGAAGLLAVAPLALAWAGAGAIPELRMRAHPVMLEVGPDGIDVLGRGRVAWGDVERVAVARLPATTDLRVRVARPRRRELRAPIGFADRPVAGVLDRVQAHGARVVDGGGG
jgi:hypothetical protein